jgi:P pilus assembly chaperone PapD
MRAALSSALAILLTGSSALAQPAPATPVAAPQVTTVGANLNVTPKRVTFSRSQRSASVYIFNQGTTPATFDIALIDRVMLPDGQIMATEEAVQAPATKAHADKVKSAKDMLLVSPRRVTLAPGKGQTIRMRARDVPGAETGEYRSHLTITTIPPRDSGVTAEQISGGEPGELRIVINSVFGLSIPAIVRQGDVDVRANIENPRIEYANMSPDGDKPPQRTAVAVFEIARLGRNSLFGNFEVRPVGARGGDPLGVARGVGVYTELERRTVRIPLTRIPAAGEKLEITFSDDDTSPGKVLAKSTT